MLKVLKVRIYPNNFQKEKLLQHFGSARFIYNFMLHKKNEAYKIDKTSISAYDLKKLLPKMKKTEDFVWLKEVDSTALQNAVLNMGTAYKNFFRRVKSSGAPGFPRFKNRHSARQSYQTQGAKREGNSIYLPKVGLVKAKFHRDFKGEIKTSTISAEAGQFFISMNIEDGKEETFGVNNGKKIGIDMGVNIFAYTSENEAINPTKEHDLTEDIVRMIKAQKKLSRKKKGSQNRKKSKLKLAKKHLKIKNKRNDFLHKTAKKLSENQTIAVENLQIKNMSKSAKGTIEIPGKNVAQKRGLNRSILQKSWGIFFEILEYKLKRNGGQLIKVDPKYTSQECSDCGHTSSQNRKKSKFICVKCQVTLHADHNAAINISMR